MKAHRLAVVALSLFLLAAEAPPEPIGMPKELPSAMPAKGAKKKKVVCRTVSETCWKQVPYTVTRMVPKTVYQDNEPCTVYVPVCETCYKNVPFIVQKKVQEIVDEGSEEATAAEESPSPQSKQLDDALAQLRQYPKDSYLQYVALQLARRENRIDEVAKAVEEITGHRRDRNSERGDSVDLFSIFTGALAVQESLQLDTMRDEAQTQTIQPINVVNRDPASLPEAAPAPEPVPAAEQAGPAYGDEM